MNLLDLKNEISKTVKIKDLDFSIKAVLPNERIEIAVKKSYLLGNLPLESVGMSDNILAIKLATIDVCAEFPDDVEWSFARDIPDSEIIEKLYDEIVKLTTSLEKKLKKNKSFKGSIEG